MFPGDMPTTQLPATVTGNVATVVGCLLTSFVNVNFCAFFVCLFVIIVNNYV